MEKVSALKMAAVDGKNLLSLVDKIWCIHYECYKFINVCTRCRIRIKCRNYLNYWSPPFDF